MASTPGVSATLFNALAKVGNLVDAMSLKDILIYSASMAT